MSHKLGVAIALAVALTAPGYALASTLVIGNGLASDCSHEAIKGRSDKQVLDLCTAALETQLMPREDTARTYVNRGVVYLRRGVYEAAERDFARAEKLWKELPEVYINRGAIRIRQSRFTEAVAELDRGIMLEPFEPEKGYYNRAVAKEALDDLQGAYMDFRKASELKPDWEMPKKEMSRFVVEKK
jgi:tetratricopeptide (TPR) repeat protein